MCVCVCVCNKRTVIRTYSMYDFVFLCVQCSKFWCRNRPGDEMKDKYNNSFISAMTMSEEMPEGSKSSSPFCHPKFTTSTFSS